MRNTKKAPSMRYPRARNRSLIGSKELDDHTAGEFDNLRVIVEPLQSPGFIVEALPVLLRGKDGAVMLGPLAANAHGVQFKLHPTRVFVVFEVLEEREKSGAGELALSASGAESFGELIGGDSGFHGFLCF